MLFAVRSHIFSFPNNFENDSCASKRAVPSRGYWKQTRLKSAWGNPQARASRSWCVQCCGRGDATPEKQSVPWP